MGVWQRVNPNAEPYSGLPSICAQLFEAKARKGLTFGDIGKALNRDEVWVAAVFYGQAKMEPQDIVNLAQTLDIQQDAISAELGPHWWPRRGLGPMPPEDPVLYRLFEGVLVYGTAIKAVIHEKFGDGIQSMIDCKVTVDKKEDPKGDRVLLTFDGKFLKYAQW
ncbi:cyanate lyase C-terminal domain-containing protein [Irpex rosettiformis]|uniref:Cyanate lyase C-terminal domain-containing protein n=1 Tax=Irpex rosettiformis TaxID=378272 RepID=A0ACB8U7M0_9APHY|nr:cyanate lyase C-terminal domain-containing protein [Irpex rosettiformis]